MINVIWAVMVLSGILWLGLNGSLETVTITVFDQATKGLAVSLQLMAIIAVWFGLTRVAEKAGFLPGLARLIAPLLRPLFPSIPPGHSSIGSISLNLTANLLGLADAATPFGLKAMHQLQDLNSDRYTITPAMTTFLILNSTTATIVPTTAIALRANAEAPEPSLIILPAALASLIATIVVLILDRGLRRRFFRMN